MLRRLFPPLLLAALFGGGCNTVVGNYFLNRARDLGECFRAEAGLGIGLGLGARAGGIGPLGLSMSNWYRALTVGVVYGEVLPDFGSSAPTWNTELNLFVWGARFRSSMPTVAAAMHGSGHAIKGEPEYRLTDLVIPVGRTYTEHGGQSVGDWVWSDPPALPASAPPPPRWWSHAGLHAFDIEAHAFVGFAGVRVGFSPGEFADFFLGWFGLDIAGDDRALPEPDGE